MEVKKSLTGASAVPNSDDTSRVQICANSGENGLFAENLSLKLILTMALPITKIHLKRFETMTKKVLTKYESSSANICHIRTNSLQV